MNYIQRKCDDKTLSHDQVFDPDKVSNINKAKFIDALNQEFEAEHPEEASLKEQYQICLQKDLRFNSLLEMFSREKSLIPQGLHLLVDAASAVGQNSALSLSIQGQSAAICPPGSAADDTDASESSAGLTMTSLLRMPRCRADSCAAGFVILPGEEPEIETSTRKRPPASPASLRPLKILSTARTNPAIILPSATALCSAAGEAAQSLIQGVHGSSCYPSSQNQVRISRHRIP